MRAIYIILGIFLLQCIYVSGYGYFSSCKSNQSDVLVVLGNKVYPDGQLSPVLKARVDKAFDAYIKGCAPRILVSGGLGKEGHYEGDKMAEYLVAKGVEFSDIYIDNNGINSYETAVNTKKFLQENNLTSVIVVTSYYHVFRSVLAMKFVGIDNASGVGSKYIAFQDFIKIPRDLAGSYVYVLKYGFK